MSTTLKIRIPFLRRKTNGGTDGLGTFYITEAPRYLPTLNQSVIITHTDVPTTSGLRTKLNNTRDFMSTQLSHICHLADFFSSSFFSCSGVADSKSMSLPSSASSTYR